MNNTDPKKNILRRVLVYSGFISFVLLWPATNVLLKNDSFRIIGNWSYAASILLVLFFFLIPALILFLIEFLLSLRSEVWALSFRWLCFLCGAGAIWTQFVAFYINPYLRAVAMPASVSANVIWVGGLIFIALIFKLRKALSGFFTYMSLFFFISVGALILDMPSCDDLLSAGSNDRVSVGEAAADVINKPVYFLILDGVALPVLLDGEVVDERFFPTFARISKEWTWYRNATTNSTSTIPARHMIFSGRYYGDKARTVFEATPGLLRMLRGFMPIHLHYASKDPIIIDAKGPFTGLGNAHYERSLKNAVTLNKALATAYIEITVPTPLRRLIKLQPWKFEWRGSIPEGYTANQYYGKQSQKQFHDFIEDAGNASQGEACFYHLWNYLTHYPFIVDEYGNIIDDKYHSYVPGMDDEARQKVHENNIKTLQYIDGLLDAFIKRLKDNGLYEDSNIIIFSDHGLSMTGSNYNVDEYVARVPLFIKAPGFAAGTNDRDAQAIDIAPTILDMLEIPIPEAYEGRSLLRPYLERKKVIYGLGRKGIWVLKDDGAWEYTVDMISK